MGPLRRMGEGIAALGVPIKITPGPLPTGSWCSHLPLWGNPLLQLERPAAQRTVQWVVSPQQDIRTAQDLGFSWWMALPGLSTLEDLVRLGLILQREATIIHHTPPSVALPQRPSTSPPILEAIYGPAPPTLPRGHFLDRLFRRWSPREAGRDEALTAVRGMLQAIPEELRLAVPRPSGGVGFMGRSKSPSLVVTAEAVGVVLGCLGWPGVALMEQLVRGGGGRPFHPMSVKSATTLQLGDSFGAQRAARKDYVNSALTLVNGGGAGRLVDPAEALHTFEKGLRALWHVPWDNIHKEPLWRLSVNGVRNAGGHDLCPSHPCPCGYAGPVATAILSPSEASFAWRLHHFHHCPVAGAVIGEINKVLPAGVTVTCADLWLLRPPSGVSHSGVWGVVAAAAIAAMHSGRKNLIRLHLRQTQLVGVGQTLITTFFPTVAGTPPPTVLQRATRWAAAWFWCLLQDFACIQNGIPPGWGAGPPATHPFLAVAPGTQRVVVRPD